MQQILQTIDVFLARGACAELTAWLAQGHDWLRDLPIYPVAAARSYERHLIGKTPRCELYLMNWGTSADTGTHGHPQDGCWLRVLGGSLIETVDGEAKVLQPGTVRHLRGLSDMHRITTDGPAFSIHIYAPRGLVRRANCWSPVEELS